ncbi:MAG: peptidoglycan bridge formation glycyltransferase FemA/FemB family protein, partial [Lactobacillaceae bacterium]|nr:peptidoglycan bridge formation glycyltransferase FemA/FemB family protein [Lactobacillaceae bacterium]
MIYKLDETDSNRYNAYRDFVKKTPNGVVTQDPKWANVKSNWGRLFLYHLNDTDEIDAIMSILFIEAVEGGTLAYASKGPLVADFSDVSLVDEFIKKAIEELPENTFLIRMDPEVEYSDELNKLYQDAGFVTRNTQFEHMHSNIQPRKNMIFSF